MRVVLLMTSRTNFVSDLSRQRSKTFRGRLEYRDVELVAIRQLCKCGESSQRTDECMRRKSVLRDDTRSVSIAGILRLLRRFLCRVEAEAESHRILQIVRIKLVLP